MSQLITLGRVRLVGTDGVDTLANMENATFSDGTFALSSLGSAEGSDAMTADKMVFATSGSDLEGLVRYDSNGDGQLSGADAAFDDFGVWQDADSDGQVDAGELQSLTAASIASISLSSDGVSYSAAGGDVSTGSSACRRCR